MKELFIDVETFSSRDLSKCGVYRYTESEDFSVLLFGYSLDGGEVHVVDLATGEKFPDELRAALTDAAVIKIAHNANFERVCLSRFLELPPHTYLPPSQWLCTMTWAAYMGLPLSLAGVGAVLGLDKKKMEEGRELIRYFCTSKDGTRRRPWDAPERWEFFKTYNKRDVEVELRIKERLSGFPVPDEVWAEYHLDQEINDRGVGLDMTLVRNAIAMDTLSRQELKEKAKRLTDLENPNSVHQMLGWLSRNGVETDNLAKKQVKKLIDEADGEVKEVLRLRQQLAKSSVRKYQAMANAVCSDGRARGMFMFYGANRTGRYSGRIIQLQNLRQNHLPDLAQARELVRKGDIETVKMLYEDVPDTLSQLVRTAFVPEPPNLFFVADFSAIEARVLSWLAGERWRMEVFAAGGDIYCATASRMFGVPVEKHGANAELRQKGKQAELSCGYGGSVGALKAMGAVEAGMKEEELKPLVEAWRAASPNIVRLWHEVERAAQKTAFKKTTVKLRNLTFAYRSGFLFITLPSGRNLAYVKPKRGENRFGEEALTYEGIGTAKKWERIETFGGKLVENCVQAISRDILCYALKSLRDYKICMHVHDEVVIEAPEGTSLEEICEVMGRTPPWAEGLVLRADGFVTPWYRKD